jgi:phosphatidylserine decarboxylase
VQTAAPAGRHFLIPTFISMKIDRAGFPFIAGALIPAAAFTAYRRHGWAVSLAALGAFFAYFFRDPERQVPQDRDVVVSPADGRVMIAGPSDKRWAPSGEWKQVTIFLSPTDVHINRSPVDGSVTRIEYRPGTFLPAYDERSNDNELNEVWLDHHGQTIVFRQVVGILARRIVCRIHEGDHVQRGERIGLMKFGSRMDVFLPMSAELTIRVGDRVVGGETVVAVLRDHRAG